MYRMNKLTIILLATLVVMILVSGCGLTPTATPSSKSLEWDKLAQQTSSAGGYQYQGAPKIETITRAPEAAILEGDVYPSILSEVANIDFSGYFVIVVFQGRQGAAGYSVQVKEVKQQGDSITVYAEFLTPDPKNLVAPVITSPYYVLKVKKTPDLKGDFTFILVASGKEVMRQQRSLP